MELIGPVTLETLATGLSHRGGYTGEILYRCLKDLEALLQNMQTVRDNNNCPSHVHFADTPGLSLIDIMDKAVNIQLLKCQCQGDAPACATNTLVACTCNTQSCSCNTQTPCTCNTDSTTVCTSHTGCSSYVSGSSGCGTDVYCSRDDSNSEDPRDAGYCGSYASCGSNYGDAYCSPEWSVCTCDTYSAPSGCGSECSCNGGVTTTCGTYVAASCSSHCTCHTFVAGSCTGQVMTPVCACNAYFSNT